MNGNGNGSSTLLEFTIPPIYCRYCTVVLVNVELLDDGGLRKFHKLFRSTLEWISTMLGVASCVVKSRAALQLENAALRHQIGVLQRSAKKRLPLKNADRLLLDLDCRTCGRSGDRY